MRDHRSRRALRAGLAAVGLLALTLAPASGASSSDQAGREGDPRAVAVLVQEHLGNDVTASIDGIRQFVRTLPQGSTVMVAYLTTRGLRVEQAFTADLDRAADAVHAPADGDAYTPNFFLFDQVTRALRYFDAQPRNGRTAVLLSDGLNRGLETEAPQGRALDLNAAIAAAKERGVAVLAIYEPSLATSYNRSLVNVGLGALTRMASETGGRLFSDGFTPDLLGARRQHTP